MYIIYLQCESTFKRAHKHAQSDIIIKNIQNIINRHNRGIHKIIPK